MPRINIVFDETGEPMEDMRHERHPRAAFQKKPLDIHSESTHARMARTCADAESIREFIIANFKELIARSGEGKEELKGEFKFPQLESVSFGFTKFRSLDNLEDSLWPLSKEQNGERQQNLAYMGEFYYQCTGENPKYNVLDAFKGTRFQLYKYEEKKGWEWGDVRKGGYRFVVRQYYKVALFLDDWPALSDQAMMDRLTGGNKLLEDFYASKGKNMFGY